MSASFGELANFIWSVADDLRGDYKQSDYGKIILPFALLRRLDSVLEGTKDAVLKDYAKRKDDGVNLDIFLTRKSKQSFYNVSPFTLPGLLADQKHVRQNLVAEHEPCCRGVEAASGLFSMALHSSRVRLVLERRQRCEHG